MDSHEPTQQPRSWTSSRPVRFFLEWLTGPLFAAMVAALLMRFASFPVGWAALTSFVLWPLAGLLAWPDDELPGGWDNPDGTEVPSWKRPEFWGRFSGDCAIVCMAFAIQIEFVAPAVHGLLAVGSMFALACIVLIRRGQSRSH